jgi:site-specific DNA-methyltransferase (adenine-specific)
MAKVLSEGLIKDAYFKSKDFFLFKSDCLEFLKKIPENSIDMVPADPLYNLSNGGFTVQAGRRVSVNKGDWDKSDGVENDFDFHTQWLEECRRVLKSKRSLLWI